MTLSLRQLSIRRLGEDSSSSSGESNANADSNESSAASAAASEVLSRKNSSIQSSSHFTVRRPSPERVDSAASIRDPAPVATVSGGDSGTKSENGEARPRNSDDPDHGKDLMRRETV